MPSSTFKGLYPECNECIYQFYDKTKNKNNCSFSHNKIRSNANTTGIKYERDFRWCGLKQKKRNKMKKALKVLKSAEDFGFSSKRIIISSHKLNKAIKELEALTTTQQTKTVTSTHTNLVYCPIKNSSCILSKCAAYTTHKEPDILKCDLCGDTFYRGQRCKNYIKGKPEHIKMSLYKNMAYCKHFKCHVYS